MQHITDDDLVLMYYGEAAGAPHLDSCAGCRERYQALQRTLNIVDSPAPERTADYGSEVWHRLSPKLGARARWRIPAARWLAVAAVASVAVAAFLAGRFLPNAPLPQVAARATPERVLVASVGDHLDRSHLVLAELLNAGAADLSAERPRARTLIDANRLYRSAAVAHGDAGVAMLLDELERVLLEIAHSPDEPSAGELDALRARVRAQALLFKVRVMGARLKQDLREVPHASSKL